MPVILTRVCNAIRGVFVTSNSKLIPFDVIVNFDNGTIKFGENTDFDSVGSRAHMQSDGVFYKL